MITEALGGVLQFLSKSDQQQWLVDWGIGGSATSSGEHITEENALNCPAVKAAVTVLAEAIQTIPLNIHRVEKSGRQTPCPEHPVRELLFREPNEETAAPTWKNTLQIHLGTYGNCYAEIQRKGNGDPIALWQRSPRSERTEPYRDRDNGKIYYRLRDEYGHTQEPVPARHMLHVPYFSTDGIIGRSPIRMIREAVGGNKGAERFANEMFKNGGTPQGYIRHPGKFSEPAYERLKKSVNKYAESGGRHKTQILEEGAEFQQTSLNPANVQMIEVRRFLLEEVARAYRITPHLMGDLTHGTFSNVSELGRQFIVYTLRPWMSLWTGEINRKLLKQPYYALFDAKEFLRGDPEALSKWYRTMFMIGYYSINDICSEEGCNQVEGPNADEHFVPLNMVPLSKATDPDWVKGSKPQPGGSEPKPKSPSVGDGETPSEPKAESSHGGEAIKAAEAVLADVLCRMERIEANAATRAARTPTKFLSSLDAFYEKHVGTIREAIALPVAAIEAVGGGPLDISTVINEHVSGKREALLIAAECKPSELAKRVAECVKKWGLQ